jgi:N-glycosylase/DNA lyase
MKSMKDLIARIEKLKDSEISTKVNRRIQEFKNINKKSNEELYKEMCFCLLTANFNAEKSIRIQNEIGECFLTNTKEELTKKLRECGHRFPNTRADYISESLKCKDKLNEIVKFHDKKALREWIVNNVKGLGYKEASHFLRNIGFDDYAIIDFHIVDILVNHKLIEKPKTITKKKYLEIEELLRKLAKNTGLTLAELDLYLWYLETGKVLK